MLSSLLGRLTLDSLPHDPFTIIFLSIGGLLSIAGLGVLLRIKGFGWFKQTGIYLWRNWFTSLDAKKIGVMYIVVAVIMLLRGITDAAMIRAQQALSVGSNHGILHTDTFQQVFSAHGSIMIFFVAMGLMFGLINLVLPLQLGARDVAFPFLNSVSFWLFVAGMMLMNVSLVLGEFSATGWLAYPPLSELAYSPGTGVDYWIWSLQIAGLGSLFSGINFLVTIIKMRAPGMKLTKMPIFAWSVVASMMLVVAAFPILTATLTMLGLDRLLGMHFFTADMGGNAMMYVNLIWAWGHPEVYILVLPAFGIYSEVVATFSRKRIFGYMSMVWALMAIAFFSFIVWLHHFFTMGAGADVNAFFGIMTMIIAIPTGVKVFNWLFTMYGGRVRLTSPMLWFLGFVVTFTIGGATGVILAIPPADFQLHNSLFLIAHFHTMIIGGVVFGYFAGITYWFPKIFGFKLHEGLGKLAFWLWLSGFCLAFVPLYILGLMGATRRLDHYDPSMGWQGLFIVAGVGVMVIIAGVGAQILQFIVSIIQRDKNRDLTGDPWDGRTLEWSTVSPAPEYNFAVIPTVHKRDAFWEMKQGKHPALSTEYADIQLPKNTPMGIFIAMGAFIFGFGLIWHMWWLAIIGLLGVITLIIIRAHDEETEYTITAKELAKLEALARKKQGLAA
jgi:cytochrome o ubiquinol oxidase subunit 1